jgi:adenine/guanine phosphoribosyltransferase-like PRPP-binding protein
MVDRTGFLTQHNGYGMSSLTNLDDIIERGVRALSHIDFDTIVGRGMSGSVVVPMLASALDKAYLIVRKQGAGAHTSQHVGSLGHKWIFVDDFVSTGATFRETKEAIDYMVRERNRYAYLTDPFVTEYVGQWLYDRESGFAYPGTPSYDKGYGY